MGRACVSQICPSPSIAHSTSCGDPNVDTAIVATLQEALANPHFRARSLFDHQVSAGGREIPAIPVPLAPEFRCGQRVANYPALGEANSLLDAS